MESFPISGRTRSKRTHAEKQPDSQIPAISPDSTYRTASICYRNLLRQMARIASVKPSYHDKRTPAGPVY